MDSSEFIRDFTEWIKSHTSLEALFISQDKGKTALFALTSHKRLFLQNFMIFSNYDKTSYCKLYNFGDVPYLEIEFESGHQALIEFIGEDYEIRDDMVELFDLRIK